MRPTGPPQLRLFGIPVRIEPTFWIITGLIAVRAIDSSPLAAAGWVVIVFVSLLVHELGHAGAFVAFGSRPGIILHGFGGLTYAAPPRGRWRSIAVSLAGPLFPVVVIGLPALHALHGTSELEHPLGYSLLQMAVWVNLYWGLLNLLPMVPLDGGHVLEQLTGRRVAAVVTLVVAIPLTALAIASGFYFAIIITGSCAMQAYTTLRVGGGAVSTRANVKVHRPSSPVPVPPTAVEQAALDAAAATPGSAWSQGAVELVAGRTIVALRVLEEAALAGPPPPEVVALLADEAMAPRLAERLLQRSGPRAGEAVAELAGALLAASRPGPAGLVAERLAGDDRSEPLATWAASAAAEAWGLAGDAARAERWARIATERSA